jgi:DNA replication protein DnaC
MDSQELQTQEVAEKYIKHMEHQNQLPLNWYDKNFSLFEPQDEAMKKLVKHLESRPLEDNVGLWISGKTGVGKTHVLYGTLISLSWKYFWKHETLHNQFKIYNYSDLCSIIRQDPNNFDLIKKIRSPRYLFIDDIGVSKSSDFIQEKIYNIFNYRCEYGLPTFVTTNLTYTEIIQEFNERMASRIKETSAWVELKNQKDYRTQKFKNNMKPYLEINRD